MDFRRLQLGRVINSISNPPSQPLSEYISSVLQSDFLYEYDIFTSRGTVHSDYLDMRRLNCKSTSSRLIQRLPLTNRLNLGVLDNPRKIQNDGNHPIAENNKLYTCGSLHKQYKQYLEFIKFLLAKFIRCKHCDPNLSPPVQAKFHYFPFLRVIVRFHITVT